MRDTYRRLAVVGAALGAWALAAPAAAEMVNVKAELNGAGVKPPVLNTASTATGTLTGTLDTDTGTLTYKLECKGLTGTWASAHFHAPPTPMSANQNRPAIQPITGGRACPIDGTARFDKDQVAQLLAGEISVNIKTSIFPAGNIEGRIARAQ